MHTAIPITTFFFIAPQNKAGTCVLDDRFYIWQHRLTIRTSAVLNPRPEEAAIGNLFRLEGNLNPLAPTAP